MAIAYDSESADYSVGTTSHTQSHTCTGADRFLIVSVLTTSSATVTGITYNGTSLTQIGSNRTFTSPSTFVHSTWYLVNPDATTANIVVSSSGTCNIFCGAASYTGVHQASPIDGSVFDEGYSVNQKDFTITPTTDGCMVIGTISGGSPIEIDSGTLRTTFPSGFEYSIIGDKGPISPAASTTITSGRIAAGGTGHVGYVVAVAPVAAASTFIPKVMFFG